MIGFPQIYSNNAAGRIEKSVKIDTNFLKNEKADVVFLYFGYVGCKNVCTPAMNEITSIYGQLKSEKIAVYFISLLEEDSYTTQAYARYFNSKFYGLSLPKKELQKLKEKLRVQTTNSLSDAKEINHAGHLYILKKDGTKDSFSQKYLYTTRPLNVKVIAKDIKELLISKNKE